MMKIFKEKIPDEQIKLYYEEALSAAMDFKINLQQSSLKKVVNKLDKLCVILAKNFDDDLEDEILLGSIAVKNTAVLLHELVNHYKDKEIGWYKDDPRFGINTYPIKFDDLVIFPIEWFKEALLSGKRGYLISRYKIELEDQLKKHDL